MAAWFVAAWGVIGWYHPPRAVAKTPALVVDSAFGSLALEAGPAPEALGKSGALRLATAMPGEHVDYPITLPEDTLSLRYAWERVGDTQLDDSARTYSGDTLVAPEQPGFYRLALLHGSSEHVMDGMTLAVLVPFDEKHGPVLDGYKIGLYRAERHRADSSDRPAGFAKVTSAEIDLPVSAHLTLGDFLSRDGQDTWPRYAAIDPRVFDKLELVLERISRSLGRVTGDVPVEFDLHSGFRTPAYNRHVPRAARDSRHQFGDALDIAIDADGNGRINRHDARLVAAAVDSVEAEYPDLVGGMGVYTSHRYSHPYVHIDVRGRRVRWHG
jgi:uncharacterized protein YcbK (DUF882 family)